MLQQKKIVVVMPAFNAGKTLKQTFTQLPLDIVDHVILADDRSTDDTVKQAKALGIETIEHERNRGYGGNQKTCYDAALERGADIVVMLHPDYQYSPRLVIAMAGMIVSGHYDLILASRILGGTARQAGMPLYKYISNRFLTAIENVVCNAKLSEYHTGFRAYSRLLLETVPYHNNSENFVFDNQLIIQALYFGFPIGEISCPTRYNANTSSIDMLGSIVYGFGVLGTAMQFRFQKLGICQSGLFKNA